MPSYAKPFSQEHVQEERGQTSQYLHDVEKLKLFQAGTADVVQFKINNTERLTWITTCMYVSQ